MVAVRILEVNKQLIIVNKHLTKVNKQLTIPMFKDFHFLHEWQMVVIRGHSLHQSVLQIEDDFLFVPIGKVKY